MGAVALGLLLVLALSCVTTIVHGAKWTVSTSPSMLAMRSIGESSFFIIDSMLDSPNMYIYTMDLYIYMCHYVVSTM